MTEPKKGKVIGKPEIEAGSGFIKGYDPENFYLSATDQHHNKSTIRLGSTTIAMPPFIVARIHMLVEDPLNPYRTAYDYVRDMSVHGLHMRTPAHMKTTDSWRNFELMCEMEREQEEAQRQAGWVSKIQAMLQDALSAQDPHLYEQTVKRAKELKLRQPYQGQIESLIQTTGNIKRIR